jgi:hypothetical protein
MGKRVFIIMMISLAFITGCANYHFNTNNNPLLGYDINSLAVPMFVNRTNIPGISPIMTKEIVLTLSEFTGLKTYGGDHDNADAVLIGIIESNDKINQTFKTKSSLLSSDDPNIKQSIGNRAPFYYPAETSYNFRLRLVLIKRPTASEISVLTSELGSAVKLHPKIVLQDEIEVSGNFSRAVGDTLSGTSGGVVNFVKNKGLLNKSLEDACIQTAKTFKQVVLNAF